MPDPNITPAPNDNLFNPLDPDLGAVEPISEAPAKPPISQPAPPVEAETLRLGRALLQASGRYANAQAQRNAWDSRHPEAALWPQLRQSNSEYRNLTEAYDVAALELLQAALALAESNKEER